MRASNRRPGWLFAAVSILMAAALAACQPSTPAPTNTPTALPVVTAAPDDEAPVSGLTPAGPEAPAPTPVVINLEGAKTTVSGLQYLEETPGKGELPKKGELVTMNYIASLPDGTELNNTYTQGGPVTTVWGVNRLLPGWEEGVGLMKAGSKAKMVLPPSLAFGEQGNGSIPPNTQIVLEVELLKSEAAPVPTDIAEDKFTKTDSGLQYYDLAVGEGEDAVTNSAVSTGYTIWVKTDSGFDYVDSSQYGTPVDFVLGRMDKVFPGWDEAATGMKVGGKRLLVIPPDLGMGSQGSGIIPPNATLVMEVELLKMTGPRTAAKVDEKDYTTTESGLKYYDITPGTGATPAEGDTVVVHYTGWLLDGTQFDSSIDRGEPLSFEIGTANIIPGWNEGVSTMKVGGKRQLLIPPDLGYGDSGAGGVIPPGATLVFEVELLEIR